MENSKAKIEEADWEVRPGGMLVQRRDHHEEDDDIHPKHNEETAAASSRRSMININDAHGPAQHHLYDHVPPLSTFEKMTSSKDKVDETITSEDHDVEEVKESEETSKALAAVARVRKEVDKLSERVAALEVAVNSGTKVADEEFVVSAELLMRELLKLDGIEAEGEAKLQRKAEVRRIQNFHETLDKLKARNSNPFSDEHKAVLVTTNWETSDSGMGSLTAPPPVSSSTTVTQDWEQFD